MKDWIAARLRETSTHIGLALVAAFLLFHFTSQQLGEYAARATQVIALLGAARLIWAPDHKEGE